MKELKDYIQAAQHGDLDAYTEVVRRFQDMAFGYAYSVLGNFQLAEDAAQEAFIEAFRNLAALRDPEAFPGWLRKIIQSQCRRFTRRKKVMTVSLDEAGELKSPIEGPDVAVQREALRASILEAIASLPSAQKTTTTLFYINGYSHREVADFLDVPVSTVKKRLHDSRRLLRERMDDMVRDVLKKNAPDSGEKAEQIRLLLSMAAQMEKGVPLLAVFDALIKETESPNLRSILKKIEGSIKKGRSLNAAMAESDVFPPMVVALIRDGEWIGKMDLACRMAGAWLRTGKYSVEQDLYRETHSPIARLLLKAAELRACEVILDSSEAKIMKPGPARPAFRPTFILRDGSKKDYDMLLLDRQMLEIEQDLKRRTILDPEQTGDELTGNLLMPPSPSARQPSWRVAYRPTSQGMVIRLTTQDEE